MSDEANHHRRNGPESRRTLDSWKQIADHLGVSLRTAYRWRDQAGLPVHRDAAGHPYAYTDELERWRRARPAPSGRRRALAVGVVVCAAAAAVAAGAWAWWHSARAGRPVTAVITRETLTVQDADGRTCWTATVPRMGFSNEWGWNVSTPERAVVADVDLDGRVDVLLNVMTDSESERPGRLICYSESGAVKWEFVFGRAFSDQYGEYSGNYLGHIVRPIVIGGRPFILAISTHRRWHPSQTALLDPRTGALVEEFWHPGAITHALTADFDADGDPELVLAGLNNPGKGYGIPVVMMLRLPFSRTPASPDSLMAGMSSGGPTAYVALPRADALEAQGGFAAVSHLQHEPPDLVLVRSRFTPDSTSNLTYRMDRDLRVRGVFPSIDLTAAHDTLWKSGALSHAFSPAELAWLETVRRFPSIPDGNAQRLLPFQPPR